MTIASMIIQPATGRLNQVAAKLSEYEGVSVHTATENQQLIILVEAPSLKAVNEIAHNIERQEGIYGVYPAYVNDDV